MYLKSIGCILLLYIGWYHFGGKNLINEVYMECSVNATCIYISYYSSSDTCFNISVLFISCFLWLSCWTVICLNILAKKIFVFNKHLIPCSSELCSMLKHTQLNQSGVLHIASTISRNILGDITVRCLVSDSLWSAILVLLW